MTAAPADRPGDSTRRPRRGNAALALVITLLLIVIGLVVAGAGPAAEFVGRLGGASVAGDAPASAATTAADGAAPVAASRPARPAMLERVAVIGASASDGFNARMTVATADRTIERPIDLHMVVEAAMPQPPAESLGLGDFMLFSSPMRTARTQIERAASIEPTFVVAIDFLFWFGYGAIDHEGQRVRSEDRRLAMLEAGMDLLEAFEAPVVVGDFPDMSDAIGGFLSRSQVPAPETRAKLNERLRAWASERPNVIVVDLDALIGDMKAGRAIALGAHRWEAEEARGLLQPDHLHPTVDGLIALVQMIDAALDGRSAAGYAEAARWFDADRAAVRDRLARRLIAATAPGPSGTSRDPGDRP